MNLGNQNSKYSWRIRDLKNHQTGTQFPNSVLMYKINSNNNLNFSSIWIILSMEKDRHKLFQMTVIKDLKHPRCIYIST